MAIARWAWLLLPIVANKCGAPACQGCDAMGEGAIGIAGPHADLVGRVLLEPLLRRTRMAQRQTSSCVQGNRPCTAVSLWR